MFVQESKKTPRASFVLHLARSWAQQPFVHRIVARNMTMTSLLVNIIKRQLQGRTIFPRHLHQPASAAASIPSSQPANASMVLATQLSTRQWRNAVTWSSDEEAHRLVAALSGTYVELLQQHRVQSQRVLKQVGRAGERHITT